MRILAILDFLGFSLSKDIVSRHDALARLDGSFALRISQHTV